MDTCGFISLNPGMVSLSRLTERPEGELRAPRSIPPEGSGFRNVAPPGTAGAIVDGNAVLRDQGHLGAAYQRIDDVTSTWIRKRFGSRWIVMPLLLVYSFR